MSTAGLVMLALWLPAAPPAGPTQVEESLLEAAAAARSRGASEDLARLMRARATLDPKLAVPDGLQEAAAAAEAWASGFGPLRIFASRVGPARVRVGVDDPAEAVDRLDVFALGAGGRARLTRADSEAAGRNEYVVPPDAGARLLVEAVMRIDGEDLVLLRLELVDDAPALPSAPSAPPASAAVAPPAPAPAPAASGVPWWWFAAAGVAAALVGAAVWQETRF